MTATVLRRSVRPAFAIFSSLGCDLGLFDKGRGDPEA